MWSSGAALCAYVLIKVEFRAAAMPLMFAMGWMAIPWHRLRVLACVGAILYVFGAPFLFTSMSVRSFLINNIPDWVSGALGQNFQELATLSERSAIWQQGLDLLFEGKYFLLGQGQYGLDAEKDGYVMPNANETAGLFRRISYHQGVLDLFFIYGSCFASILCVLLLLVVGRGAYALFNRGHRGRVYDDCGLAMFCLAVTAITNSQDGFLAEHPFFFIIILASLDRLWRTNMGRRSSCEVYET